MERQIWRRWGSWWLIGLIILLSIAGVTAAEDLSGLSFYELSQSGDATYKPGELIVRFADVKPGVQLPGGPVIIGPLSRSSTRDVISNFAVAGAFVCKEYDRIVPGLTVVKLPEGVSVPNALVSLNKTANVLYAEPNYKLKLLAIPNDTRFSELWGMNNIGQTGGTVDADIDAPEAWDVSTGSSSVIVAVTDTGVDYTHPDLAENMWKNPGEISGNGLDDDGNGYIDDIYGYDFYLHVSDPMDDYWHGTHVSGTIGAKGNNSQGVAGVCWNVKIMALKIFDHGGGYIDSMTTAAIDAIEYAIDKKAKVINASWGLPFSQGLYSAIEAAKSKDILFVAAAGNDSSNNDMNPVYPACYDLDNIISVLATNHTDQMAYYSNYGKITVDIGAPGGETFPVSTRGILSCILGGGYAYAQGTSMASPHVAGACALLWAANPSLTYSQIKDVLLTTVDKTLPNLCVSGGRLNLFNAINEVIQDTGAPSPDPAEWEIKPQATGLHTIAMRAKEATDRSGVEYFFECVTDANFNSGWRSGRQYERADYAEGTAYTFRVKYRDKSENQNETDWSSEESTTTASGSDTLPPFPSPSQWKIKPKVIRIQPTPIVRMSADISTDENGPVEYFFTCTYIDPPGPPPSNFNSGWISSNTYTISSGLTVDSTYTFTVKTRDAAVPTQTVVSTQSSVTVSGIGKSVLTVPVPYATIQAAINAASDGDTVEVRRGTYRGTGNRDINFRGKAITVRSVDPSDPGVVDQTIIDVQNVGIVVNSLQLQNVELQDLPIPQIVSSLPSLVGSHRAFDFYNAEGPESILAGFTIKNGLIYGISRGGGAPDANGLPGEDLGGGAIRCRDGGGPTIRNCVITDCWVFGGIGGNGRVGDLGDPSATPPVPSRPGGKGGHGGKGMGGGIYCDAISVPTISNCTISSCLAVGGYGGVGGHGEAVQDPNTAGGVGGNAGDANDGMGGGICDAGSNASISNCTISDCFTTLGLGGSGGMGAPPWGWDGTDGNGFGGGMFYGEGYMSSLVDTKVLRNGALDDGGGIYFFRTAPYTQYTLTNCDIFNNNCIHGNGGGIWYDVNGTLILSDCEVIGNVAPAGYGGGGIYAGGLASPSGITVIIDSNSTISSNTAGYNGGGLSLIKANLTVKDSTISDNSAFEGAGVWAYNCTADINNCMVRGNSATELGGGFSIVNSVATSRATINNSIMTGNSATGSADGTGGALFFEGFSYSPHQLNNCLITENTAYSNGGGLSNNAGAWVYINNCTFADNVVYRSNGVGGGISCAEYWAYVEIFNSILWGNEAVGGGSQIAVGDPDGSMPIGEGPYAGVDVSYSDIQGGEEGIWLEDETQTYTSLWWLDGSIDDDPLFAAISATEQTYFLSQVAAEQLQDSPCVDTGYGPASGLEAIIGIPLTTRTDYVADSGTVDMGYHYKAGLAMRQYRLTIEVIDQGYGPFGTVLPPWQPGTYVVNQGRVIGLHAEPNDGWQVYQWTGTDYVPVYPADPNYNTVTMNSNKTVTVEFGPAGTYKLVTHVIGNGTVQPAGLTIWPPGTVVTLTAMPDNPANRIRWTGTDNDLLTSLTNTVTMNAHKEVFVEFYEPRMLDVPGEYTNLQMALDDANDGDIIIIAPGVYDMREAQPVEPPWPFYPNYEAEFIYINGIDEQGNRKAITITSVNPDDPCCVAATVLTKCKIVMENVDRGTIINGITIRDNYYWFYASGLPYQTWYVGIGTAAGLDSPPGLPTLGGALQLGGSWLYHDHRPGGLFTDWLGTASPTITNCIFQNCSAHGVYASNANSGTNEDDGTAGHGSPGGKALGGGAYCGPDSSPLFVNCSFIRCYARGGDGSNGGNDPAGHGGGWGAPDAPWYTEYGPFEDFWRYSGYGGAVYCDINSTPKFVDCNFTGNYTVGGCSGVSGTTAGDEIEGWPYRHFKTDSFGGAVYCADNSSPTFTGCTFTDSEADINGLDLWHDVGERQEAVIEDPYISYGGAVAFENDANPTFNKCTFNDNLAALGGGMWSLWAEADINDCNFILNTAYHGGGVYFAGGAPQIVRSKFSENKALYDTSTVRPDDPNVMLIYGEGGAIHIFDADLMVVDSNVSNNNAGGSGGGIFVSGSSNPLVKNCLITGNFAMRDGGGISNNWHSGADIINCTIADNAVTVRGTNTGFGGGLYCSYNSYVDIINSIIWGNFGTEGAQLALFTGFKSDPRPSTADVKYSVVGPPGDVNVIIVPAEALAINVSNNANVLVNSILGPGIELIGTPRYTGASRAAGTFVGGLAAGIGIESGVILTSGDANLALPPNTSDSITADNNLPGDPDLDALIQEVEDVNTFDATILEFTFKTRGGNLFFNFVFASEEYNEFTNSPYNDVFGFFLDGENIALIPGTTTPVAINNVNGGNPLGSNATNSHLYNNNDPSDGGPYFAIEYDGFTDVFTAQAFNVGRGTHTIKLAIADTSDRRLDSAVFIEGGSFSDKALYPDPIYVGKGCKLNGWNLNAPDPNDPWDANTYNLRIDDDPLFVNGYYLSQIAAGQLFDSPCVDAGSDLSSNLGLDTYTTRTDSFPDAYDPNNPGPNSVIVDMGYHYPLFTVPQYKLTFEVNDINIIEPNIYDPNYDGLYNWYTTVPLKLDSTAYNSTYYQVWWTGTDDDSISGPNNIVTMDSDKLVTARLVKAKYDLQIKVNGGNGRLFAEWLEEGDPCDIEDPCTYPVKFGTVVQLTAVPDEGFRVKKWSGTDNDASRMPSNIVTMNFDRTVRVEFGPPTTIAVPGDYSSIQQALDAAEEGDTVLIAPGTYTTSTGYLIQNKAITISGIAPDDPCVVAATVINLLIGEEGYISTSAFRIYNVGHETVLNGITIRGFSHRAYGGLDAGELGEDGYNGGHAFGGGIICDMASPTIKNCIIADCNVVGGNGGDGYDGSGSEPTDPNIRGTDGGWPGRAYGGGLACLEGSSPAVINCTFDNCVAIGGNGGDGGNGNTARAAYGRGGRGGGWYYGEDSYWYNRPWVRSSQGYSREGPVRNSFYDFYNKYTARGGAVFIGEQCSPVFTHCTFTNNRTEGGTCGICGLDGWPPTHRSEPSLRWEIENFGGAVYCETNSSPNFVDCTFAINTADVNYPSYNDDPYVSYGGAVAWETDANVVFENCIFNDNLAGIGGAMYGEWANPSIVDCNLTANTAYHGGGLYFVGGIPDIVRSDFSENEALYDTSITDSNNPVEVLGEGGAIHCVGSNITIVDCNIFNNDAATSGGGIYITGSSESLVKNCLITDNFASRDGGGTSVNWYSDCNIVNCTISGNTGLRYGGGLYCSYDSYTNIINNIIWNNIGINGSQLAVGTGYVYDPRPSVVNISYSDVGFQVVEYESIDANSLPVIRAGFDINELAANDDESTALVDIGFEIDFFGGVYSQLYVNNNGNVTFDANMAIYTPFGLTGNIGTSIIAPFFADVDTRPGSGSTGALTRYGTGMVDGHAAFGVTWIDVGYFNIRWDKLNSFQLILIDRSDRAPGDFDIEFNYEKIQWETGDASGGRNGFGGYSARAGFSNGTGNPGTFYEFEGSGVPGAFLDSSPTGLIYDSRKSSVNGRYIFAVQSGLPELLATVPIYIDVNCALDGLDWNIDTNNWEPNFTDYHNINEDPCFIAGYFLSQIAAGQRVNSPCVDSGSANANAPYLGLHTYTTRTDSVLDGGIVDMGYHCRPFTVPQYRLTFETIDANELGWPVPVIIEPVSAEPDFYEGLRNWYTTVQLRIDSNNYDPNIYQVLWTGTDDDDISGPDNTVTMSDDKVVTVQFVKTKYNLTIEVYGENGRLFAQWSEDDIIYNIEDPYTSPVKFGTVVQLTAEPDEGFRVKRWIGTDNDSSRSPNNTVTMNSDRTVRVEFGLPVVVSVPQDYATIQDAVSAAESGDTIVVYPGTYYGGYEAWMLVVNKSVTIRSEHPDDPCCVAQTIIDGYRGLNEFVNRGIVFTANAVLDGITIQNCGGTVGYGEDGSRTDPCHPDGWDGGCAEGHAVYIYAGASPIIKNCIIRDNVTVGGDGGDGVDADEDNNAGRGGWAGWSRGGAVYCGVNSSPQFINCKILNNEARGGNGGNGGNYSDGGGRANYGGNWSLLGSPGAPVLYINSNSLGVTSITDRNLWEVLEWSLARSYWPMYGQPTRTSYFGDYRWYSGYGGGVYCDENSTVDFNDCTISGNIALGGMSGQGGERGEAARPQEPLIPYEIPSYGGGIYCAAGSFVTFSGCTLTDNISSPPAYVDPNNPDSGLRHSLDPYLGHGGGVCAEKTASVEFTDCTFSENEASLGGGMFWDDANAELIDSNIVDNVAYKGGGVYFNSGLAEIVQSDFSRNDANGPAGEGGGIYCSDANITIADCNLIYNDANSSGGGAYVSNSVVWFKNCLITNNLAGRDGGGISVNLYAESLITNCTFVSNAVPGTFGEPDNTGFGGGLYCGYESSCEVNDSIFWDNLAIRGVEIAVYTGFKHEPSPSTLTISYSDVKGGQAGVGVDTGCTLNWLAGNIVADPLFVTGLLGDYYLSQTDSGQSQNSPCVDTGSDLASNLDMVVNLIDMTGYTTRTDDELDRGIVDMGYHYPSVFEICGFCNLFDRDLNGDPEGFIDFRDFAVFASHWLNKGCSKGNDWCGGADITTDTDVNNFDLAAFVNCWLAEDTAAPVPNPSEWETLPHGTTSISMEAKQAVDGWGWDVKYCFERLPLGDPCSGWRSSPTWTDTSVVRGTVYGYRVKTRDELGNEGEWSEIAYGGEQDNTPPAPAPRIDSNEPNSTFIIMTSTIAYDDSGDEYVEYYFDTNKPSAHDSGWLSFAIGETPTYTDVNLVPSTKYAYRVQARDHYNNTTNWSDWVYITTLPPPDTTKPLPNPAQWDNGGDPNGHPRMEYYWGGSFDYWAEMRAQEATDASTVYYKFVCNYGGLSSDWQQDRSYAVNIGQKSAYTLWYVIVRDEYWNITGPSPIEAAWPPPPYGP